MRGRRIREVLAELWRVFEHVLPVRPLRVQDAQRVGLGPLDLPADQVGMVAPVGEQDVPVARPALGVTHRVAQQPNIAQPEVTIEVVREGDHLDLGDQHLIIHTAPGHTPGNMFIEGLVLHEGAQTYRGIWGGGGGGAPGLAGAEQGVKNAEKLNAVKGVQVYLQTHAWQDPNGYPGGGIHERAKKLANRKPGDPNPFVDPATWDARAKRQLETAKRVLAEEQAKASATKANKAL